MRLLVAENSGGDLDAVLPICFVLYTDANKRCTDSLRASDANGSAGPGQATRPPKFASTTIELVELIV